MKRSFRISPHAGSAVGFPAEFKRPPRRRRSNHAVVRVACIAGIVCLATIATARADSAPKRATQVSIESGRWHINDQVTYPGAKAEGLLMNVRMVNATFEDRKQPDFDADANTAALLKRHAPQRRLEFRPTFPA